MPAICSECFVLSCEGLLWGRMSQKCVTPTIQERYTPYMEGLYNRSSQLYIYAIVGYVHTIICCRFVRNYKFVPNKWKGLSLQCVHGYFQSLFRCFYRSIISIIIQPSRAPFWDSISSTIIFDRKKSAACSTILLVKVIDTTMEPNRPHYKSLGPVGCGWCLLWQNRMLEVVWT